MLAGRSRLGGALTGGRFEEPGLGAPCWPPWRAGPSTAIWGDTPLRKGGLFGQSQGGSASWAKGGRRQPHHQAFKTGVASGRIGAV